MGIGGLGFRVSGLGFRLRLMAWGNYLDDVCLILEDLTGRVALAQSDQTRYS